MAARVGLRILYQFIVLQSVDAAGMSGTGRQKIGRRLRLDNHNPNLGKTLQNE